MNSEAAAPNAARPTISKPANDAPAADAGSIFADADAGGGGVRRSDALAQDDESARRTRRCTCMCVVNVRSEAVL